MHRAIFVIAALLTTLTAACSNNNSATTTTATAAPAKMKPAKVKASSNGAAVFNTNCSTCHSNNGKGGIAPPLAGNPLVTGDPKKVIHIVKDGLTGAVQVNGKSYNGNMPAWKGTLTNDDMAAVIAYIRSSWGNKAGSVTSAQVASTP